MRSAGLPETERGLPVRRFALARLALDFPYGQTNEDECLDGDHLSDAGIKVIAAGQISTLEQAQNQIVTGVTQPASRS
jgi:hypothetical protein